MISTPPVAQLEKDYPDLCPRPDRRETVRSRADDMHAYPAATSGGGRTYVVEEGDTLSSIARNELGKVSRWAEIYQLNREATGQGLRLPHAGNAAGAAAAGDVARGPHDAAIGGRRLDALSSALHGAVLAEDEIAIGVAAENFVLRGPRRRTRATATSSPGRPPRWRGRGARCNRT